MTYRKKDADLPEFAKVERDEMLRGTGLGEEGIRRPQIGVVSSWGEVNPGSVHLDRISRAAASRPGCGLHRNGCDDEPVRCHGIRAGV
jgi:dihydroxyacid dehydratase/phosphogluconate dehydratase